MSSVVAAIGDELEKRWGRGVSVRLLAGVSGGADSVALLSGLVASGADVGVAHLDHGTRDGESARDAEWVEALAASMGVSCFVRAVDVPGLAAGRKGSFEEVAREVRYDFLAETARAHGYEAIATGHHADDQAETVLMRIVRGTSLMGLGGIPEVGEWDGVVLIRPLLGVSRADIEVYLHENDLEYLEDASNADRRYVRNRIRHELLPMLREEFNPRVDSALRNLAALSRDEDGLLRELAGEAMAGCVDGESRIDRERFRGLHRAIQRRILVELGHRVGGVGEFSIVDGAVDFVVGGESGSRYDFGNGVMLSNGRSETLIVAGSVESAASVSVDVPGSVSFDGCLFRFSEMGSLPEGSLREFCSCSRQVVDGDALGGAVVLRHRRDGDRIRPLGMRGTRKLKDYFGDSGIPLEARDRVPIVACGSEIVWIVGYGVSEAFAVRDSTKRGILIEVDDGVE